MPDSQPSNAPQADAPLPTEELTAAAVLRDDSAGPSGTGSAAGAAMPNSPIDAELPHDSGRARVEAEARVESSEGAAEPGHMSQ